MRSSVLYRILVSLLVLTVLASGCAQAPAAQEGAASEEAEAAAEVVEITFLHVWGEDWQAPVWDSIISEFEAANPNIKVTMSYVPYTDSGAKMRAAALANDASFDVLPMGPEYIASLVNVGYLEDLNPWLEAEPEFADSLAPEASMKFQDATRALGIYIFPFHLLYNVDMFAEKGLEPPSNWEEFREAAQALRDEEQGIYGYMATMSFAEVLTTRMFLYRLAQLGGKLFDEDGNVAFDSPEGLETIRWWKAFWDDDLISPASLTMPWPGIMELMAAGRLGMFTDGPFTATYLKSLNPDINIAYAPPWRDQTGGIVWNVTGIAMSAMSENKQEAWQFIKFLYSDEIASRLTDEIMGAPVPTKAVMASLKESDNPVMREVPDLFAQDPDFNIQQPVLPNMEKLVDAVLVAFHEVMLDENDPESALKEMAEIWQAEIDAAR
jgi:multiple sugar transport system substrate-binding protein